MDDWAEIRRLHVSERVSIKEIARRLGLARNTVRAAVRSSEPPRYERAPAGSVVDGYEPAIRSLLMDAPRMSSTEIASRINWPYSMSPLKRRLTQIRPQYKGIDPCDRTVYEPGDVAQCDLWFPDVPIPVAPGQSPVAKIPVLGMTLGYSKLTGAVMLPSRQGGDLTAGMWSILSEWGVAPRRLVWDQESAIGGGGKVTELAKAFAGSLGIGFTLAPSRDAEFKGMIERRNGYFETSFLPGRRFSDPHDFNRQLRCWLAETANTRVMRGAGVPAERFAAEAESMVGLPAVAPATGLRLCKRLGRDYYLRVASNDYSIDPGAIGRLVEVRADPATVRATCEGRLVAEHTRSWGRHLVVTDPEHQSKARALRASYQQIARQTGQRATRAHRDGHQVAIRALSDYDQAFGVDFAPTDITGHPREEA